MRRRLGLSTDPLSRQNIIQHLGIRLGLLAIRREKQYEKDRRKNRPVLNPRQYWPYIGYCFPKHNRWQA